MVAPNGFTGLLRQTSIIQPDDIRQLADDGYLIRRSVVAPPTLQSLTDAIAQGMSSAAARVRRGASFAIRNLLDAVPAIRELAAERAVRDLVEPVLGPTARVVRAILFDKTESANWYVAWHQDTTIAVRERRNAPGFGPWSVKAGVPHVQPPVEILEDMLTLRIHLDDCDASQGALDVLPGSHRMGLLGDEAIQRLRGSTLPVTCAAKAGDVLLMRPLLLHSSRPAERPAHRRVVHLEFAAGGLPHGLHWHDAAESVPVVPQM